MKYSFLILAGKLQYANKVWSYLVDAPNNNREKTLVNAVNLLTIFGLCVMLLINLILTLLVISILNFSLIIVCSFFYYLSRYKGRHTLTVVWYGIISYVALVLCYCFNGGLDGPTLLLFFLTFQMLVAITPKKQHLTWTTFHIVIAAALVLLQNNFSGYFPHVYRNERERFFDNLGTYVIVLVFGYFITIYLRNSYNKEHALATERLKNIEEQNQKLEQLSREKDKLFSIISHDMRSPLITIQGYLELMACEDLENDSEVKKELLNITRETSDMLLNMLSWQKSQMHGLAVNLAPIDLNKIITQTLAVQGSIAAKKEIDIRFVDEKPVNAYADANMLQLAVRNVINNAIKFTPAKGVVSINTYYRENTSVISIKDNGIGIPSGKDVFAFAARTTYGTNNEKGTGIGLPLSREFIELQNGSITFSRNGGIGTEFIISLPADSSRN